MSAAPFFTSWKRFSAVATAVAACMGSAFAATATLQPKPLSVPSTWTSGLYTYDGSGHVISIAGPADTYLYDAVGRLVQASANTADHANAQSLSYDAFGNVLEIDSTIKIGTYLPSTTATIMGVDSRTNRLTNATPCNAPGTPTCITAGTRGYDAAGNMLGSLNGDQYDVDALHAVIERRGASGLRQRYLYDVSGERVAILYLPSNSNVPTDVDFTLRGRTPQLLRVVRVSGTGSAATWSWREDYVFREHALLAAVIPDATPAGKRQHFHLDHLGTPRLVTDDRGYKVSLHVYWPFGSEAPGSQADAERLKFTGHERDFGDAPERDLDYMHARYYGPLSARFLSVDSVAGDSAYPQSLNRYSYVTNDPAGTTDPLGLCGERADFIGPPTPCDFGFTMNIDVAAKAPHVSTIGGGVGSIALLLEWGSGSLPRNVAGSAASSEELANTPAMDNIRKSVQRANCQPGMYSSDFQLDEFTHTDNVTGQVVGGFVAKVKPLGNGKIIVHAMNTWGRASLTRLPGPGNRSEPSVQQLLGYVQQRAAYTGQGPGSLSFPQPSSVLDDVSEGSLADTTVHYSWMEDSPCGP